ncbi:YHYH protein [Mesonia phycicola]|uniref:YHYH protein n=1 Tax=Mesonia phycicola TaxID=579105 RepID=A0A1M6A3E9_9FLAO|nr:YHYH protein [Mesonia phycicola]SHI30683.1 YHYH protein [Mesonia phycicola]
MKKNVRSKLFPYSLFVLFILGVFVSCADDDSTTVEEEEVIGEGDDGDNDDDDDDDEVATELHAAFEAFNTEATTIYLDGSNVVIETTGLPNHETVYWGEGNDLYLEEPDVETTPSIMSSNNNAVTITVDATPDLTGSTVATELNTIGIAVSGASIFNDQEGNGALSQAAASLDWTGAHIGPGVYHYHLEPKAFSNDDENLVGILLDGVFLYGRKCYSTSTYPTDLDESGGHTSVTQYTDGNEEYHYHIINELYSNTGSYIAFAGPFQGY